MPRPKKTNDLEKTTKKRGRPAKKTIGSEEKKVKAVKKTSIRKKTTSRKAVKKMTEKELVNLIEKRKKNTQVPILEYEYNLRLALFFGILIGVIVTTYLWVLVNFIYI